MQHAISINGKQLTVFATSLHGPESAINDLGQLINPVWQELVPFIKQHHQVIYVRDLPDYAIDGQYPGGHTFVPTETQIAVPAWPADDQHLHAVVAHELHHMARWQNAGYGDTLGRAIITEGLAVAYEAHKSGWTPPYATHHIEPDALKQARAEWDLKNYNHGNWFYDGPHGRWAGYAIGYKIVREVIFAGSDFKLADSLTQTYDDPDLIAKLAP